jgi:tetratricopeptide (TPR) repeat protein
MGKILPFPGKRPPKFGFERVGRHVEAKPDMLSPGLERVPLRSAGIGPFEEALLLDESDDSRAGDAYRRAISEGDLAADAYCNLGILESRAGRTAKAFDCFTKSLEHDPRHFESHYNLGNLYFEGDNLRLARMHYEFAAEINPSFPNLYFNLGLVLALLNETKAAIDALVKYQLLAAPEECRKAEDLIRGLRKGAQTK